MNLNPERLEQAGQLLRSAKRVMIFTGAGVSAESNIPTFRDGDGLWQRFPPEEFANWGGLVRAALHRPEELAEFLIAVLEPIAIARPNVAHQVIAQIEKHIPTRVITQNVDGLHQEVGSTCVREVHGSFFQVVTLKGRFVRQLARQDLVQMVERLKQARSGIFRRSRLAMALRPFLGPSLRGIKRPRIVLFGDAMAEPDWTQAQADVGLCDLVVVVGTSGMVYPAAMLPERAREQGASIIGIDPEEPGNSHVWLRGRAGDVLPLLVRAAFGAG